MHDSHEHDYFEDFAGNWWNVYLPRLFQFCQVEGAALNYKILNAIVDAAMDTYATLYQAKEFRTGRYICHVLFQLPEEALETLKAV